MQRCSGEAKGEMGEEAGGDVKLRFRQGSADMKGGAGGVGRDRKGEVRGGQGEDADEDDGEGGRKGYLRSWRRRRRRLRAATSGESQGEGKGNGEGKAKGTGKNA